MEPPWWKLARLLSRLSLRLYYADLRVEHAERIPSEGPVLFVLNHPNSLLDPAALIAASPRPVRFAAKGPLFRVPLLGFLLRKLGAIPIDRPGDRGSDVRRNLAALERMAAALREGGACAIFPEGLSHADPELKTVRSGPARIALDAEEAAGGNLGLRVVPVGLSFFPKQMFRGDAVVRVGVPFEVRDLLGGNRHGAVRTVQERIAGSLRPLIHHLDRVDLAPLVDAVAGLYAEQRTGRGGRPALPGEEVRRIAGAALNHFLAADPKAVEEIARLHSRYLRISGRTGVPGSAVDFHERPGRAWAAFLGRGLLLVLGFPVLLYGVLGSFLPYRVTSRLAGAAARRGRANATVLPFYRVLAGLVVFGAWWGLLGLQVHLWSRSLSVTAVFLASLPVTGLLARAYATRMHRWTEALEALRPVIARRGVVRRVAAARAELLTKVEALRDRYAAQSGEPLLPREERRVKRRIGGSVAAVAVAGLLAWFLAGMRGTGLDEIALPPSPWKDLPAEEAARVVEGDARALAGTLDTLADLERRMIALRGEIDGGRTTFYEPATDKAIRGQLLTYLSCREVLLRLAWYYRDPDRAPPELALKGFLVGYGAGTELCSRGMQFVEAFDGSPQAVRKLNEGDPAGEIPPGIWERIRGNLADADLLDAMAAATARFDAMRAAGGLPSEDPWPRVLGRAAEGAEVTAELSERLWKYKWRHAVARAVGTGDGGRYAVSSLVSTWIGDARLRKRREREGMITPDQVVALRAVLRPGDILIERRNWYLSNAFLPGYWKHAAVYLGGAPGLEALGVAGEPAVVSRLEDLRRPDHGGHRKEVLEAISEGVVFTSLEESMGGADAVAVFRPRLPPERVREAVVRAVSQQGKPYDFDFDFFSTDRLVCTEVVYQAYQESIRFPLQDIMGRRTLPALDIVRLWAEGRGKPDAPLEFVAFYDGDERTETAREAGPDELAASIDRPSVTPLQEDDRGVPLLLSPAAAGLLAMLGVGLWVFRRRREGGEV